MSHLQPSELLKIVGRWMRREEAISFIVEMKSKKGKKTISRRWAYELMKKDPRVRKYRFQNGTTIYGIAEFGPPPSKQLAEATVNMPSPKTLLWMKDYEFFYIIMPIMKYAKKRGWNNITTLKVIGAAIGSTRELWTKLTWKEHNERLERERWQSWREVNPFLEEE